MTMLKFDEIKELIKLLDETSVAEVKLENEGSKIVIRKPIKSEPILVQGAQTHQPVVLPTAVESGKVDSQPTQDTTSQSTAQEEDGLHSITSPMVGTFYAAPSPTSSPYVQKGDKVTPSTVVCIVEAMKLMNEIEAEVSGEIVDILVENGQLVEFGQPLFLVRPE